MVVADMRPEEDSHREHKKRASTKGLRSKCGVNVKLKVKKETEDVKEHDSSRTAKKETGDNTAESTNEYHSKQLMEVHHTLTQKERTPDKNMFARREQRKKKQVCET